MPGRGGHGQRRWAQGPDRPASASAARGETPAAFGRRCIPADCVAPPSNIPDILGRRALSSGRLAALGATPDFHHGLLAHVITPPKLVLCAGPDVPPAAARRAFTFVVFDARIRRRRSVRILLSLE